MKRKYILLLILFLAIGFASISTTLVITGVIGFGTKNNDFKVIFTGAILDGIDKSNILISDDKIRIDYETEKLWKINDTSVLEFEVTNTSTQYDANVVLECDEINHEAIDFSITPSTMEIKPNEVRTGSITITLNRAVYTENLKINFSCRLKATAGEKTKAEVIEEINNLYNVSGNLQDKDGNPINATNLVVYSEKKEVVTDRDLGYFFVSGLEKGFHHIYKVPENITEYEEEDIQEYLIAEIATNGYIMVYDDNYKIVNYESSQDLEDIGNYCPYDSGTILKTFSYKGSIEEYEVPCKGTYKLEVWGAQGGGTLGGNGGYTYGDLVLENATTLYVGVGGRNGYNGGGSGANTGGGATHIAYMNNRGLLSKYSENTDEILIVAGGGGGASSAVTNYVHLGDVCIRSVAGGASETTGARCSEGYITGNPGEGATSTTFGIGGVSTSGKNKSDNAAGNAGSGGGGGGGYFGGGGGAAGNHYCGSSKSNRAGTSGSFGKGGNGGSGEYSSDCYHITAGGGGGGGSNYINYDKFISETTSIQNGVQSGNGYARITLVS